MGIYVPRPSMRKAEARRIKEQLATHALLVQQYIHAGKSPEDASKEAYADMKFLAMANRRVRKPRS
jgi:hypothetical protein